MSIWVTDPPYDDGVADVEDDDMMDESELDAATRADLWLDEEADLDREISFVAEMDELF